MKKNTTKITLFEQVAHIVETKLQPAIQMDGGDIELIDVEEETGVVTVQLGGACVGCPMSHITLSLGVERELLAIPKVERIEVLE